MDKATHVILVVALTVVIVGGIVYLTRTVSVECWNWPFGLGHTCSASTVK